MQHTPYPKSAILALIVGALLLHTAEAAPNSADSIIVNSSETRVESQTGTAVSAQAGNVSQLIVNDTRVTDHWQGYFGRVTGTITLDDARNNTLFDWKLANPVGEIYASNSSTVNWVNATCINLTGNGNDGTRSKINNSILEDVYNITGTDIDGINETFNYTFSGSFSVGSTLIDSSYNCPLVYLYQNDEPQESSFKELLLTDNTSVLFTAILENDIIGFDGNPWDFQMLVPENRAPGTTDYYFYVELS